MKVVTKNKKAYFDYQILDEYEAGLVLTGPEIKAVRANRVIINGAYVKPFNSENKKTELWLVGSNFHVQDDDVARTKKLLLHAREVEKIIGQVSGKGYTIVPLELYIKHGHAKLKIGLATHKQKHDKRQLLRERDINRDVQRQFRAGKSPKRP